MTSNTLTIRAGIAYGLILSFLAFSLPMQTNAQVMGGRDFCAQVDTITERLTTNLSQRVERARARHQAQEGQVDDRREERLSKLTTARATADNAREQRYEKLREQAASNAHLSAVETFVSTVETLVDERRASIDAAIDTFESTVATLEAERNSETESFINDMESAIAGAIDTARSACENGDDAVEVRKALMTGLEEARTGFAQRRETYTYREQLQEAREARQNAFETAWEEFRTGFNTAQEELKASFGVE